MWDKRGLLNLFWQFLCERLPSFNPKRFYDSYACSCSLRERRTSVCTGRISRKLRVLTRVFGWLYFTQCPTYLLYNGFPSIGKLWSCCCSFHSLSNNLKTGCSFSSHSLTILVLIWIVFVIIWETFLVRISLNSVLLLLLLNFVSGFRLELMYVSLIVSIRSSLTHLHGFQQLVLLP